MNDYWERQRFWPAAARPDRAPWWCDSRFPLVPVVQYCAADRSNTSRLVFSWLIFGAWTHDCPLLSVEARVGDRVMLQVGLPYLYLVVGTPHWWWWYGQRNFLRRKP